MSSFTSNASCNINSIDTASLPTNFTSNTQNAWCGFDLPSAQQGNIGVLMVDTGACCGNASTRVSNGCFQYCPVVDGVAPSIFQHCIQSQARRTDGVPVGNVSTICTQKVLDDVRSPGNSAGAQFKASWMAAALVGVRFGTLNLDLTMQGAKLNPV